MLKKLIKRLTAFVLTLATLVAVWEIGDHIYLRQPVHQVVVNCYDHRVHFEGPLNEQFIGAIARELAGHPYFVRDGRVFTTSPENRLDNIEKDALDLIYPKWRSKQAPNHQDPEIQRTLLDWVRSENISDNVSKEYCRVLEAAIAKDGIDAEARRKNPDIWPPDKWPVPKEQVR